MLLMVSFRNFTVKVSVQYCRLPVALLRRARLVRKDTVLPLQLLSCSTALLWLPGLVRILSPKQAIWSDPIIKCCALCTETARAFPIASLFTSAKGVSPSLIDSSISGLEHEKGRRNFSSS